MVVCAFVTIPDTRTASWRSIAGHARARYVAFTSTADLTTGNNLGQSDVFVKDVQTGTLTRVSSGFSGLGGGGGNVSISGDGRFVLFDSPAGNLVAGDTNVAYDVFIRDMQGGIQRVSTDSNGIQADASSQNATFSADGRYVVFSSAAGNLVAGWQIARAMLVALTPEAQAQDAAFMAAKVATCRFYGDHILARVASLRDSILQGGESVTAMPVDAF